jgi:hypothetical protein
MARLHFVACAAPAYLEAAGTPTGPDDLPRHVCLVHKPPFAVMPWNEWFFERSGERRRVAVPAALVTDDREALLAAALAGAGIVRVGMFDPGLLASGTLRRVLPDWSCPGGPTLHALYRRTAEPVPKVAAFLDFFAVALVEFDSEGLALTPVRRKALHAACGHTGRIRGRTHDRTRSRRQNPSSPLQQRGRPHKALSSRDCAALPAAAARQYASVEDWRRRPQGSAAHRLSGQRVRNAA